MARSPSRGRESAPIESSGERRRGGNRGRGGDDRRDGPQPSPLNIGELEARSREELIDYATEHQIDNAAALSKQELIFRILQDQAERRGNIFSGGVLTVVDDGFGFLRGERLLPGRNDVYVSRSQIGRFGLRSGDYITGQVRQPKDSEKYYGLLRVDAVNGVDPEEAKRRTDFDSLTPIFPNKIIRLETDASELSQRMVDLFAPVGRGQRALIVSPPKAGKTMLLKSIAHGIAVNSPEMHLMVLLIGERPEEVTDMRRSVRGEVVASTFDEPVEDHTRVAEAALERAKRLVEGGTDVVILMDSVTRLARAYNLAMPTSGRTLSGGMDPVALYPPKRFFGARALQRGGRLAHHRRHLPGGDRLAAGRGYIRGVQGYREHGTASDAPSGRAARLPGDRRARLLHPTARKLLFSEEELRQVWLLRRMSAMVEDAGNDATERVLERVSKTETNEEFPAEPEGGSDIAIRLS